MRSVSLDLLRFIAIFLLLITHISQTLGSPLGGFFGIHNFYWVSLGGVSVTIFLVISGAVLELNYGNLKIKYFQFLSKRILRIYPIYLLSLLFGISIYCLRSYHATGYIFANFNKLGMKDILPSITASYAFVGKWGGPFVDTSWFIILIMTMYICFPFLSYQIKKKPFLTFIILLLISVTSRFILGKYILLPCRPLDWFPLCRLFEFSLGIYLINYRPKHNPIFFELPKRIVSLISWISIFSFPLFLIHSPLLFIINYLTGHGISDSLAIICFLSVSLFVSWVTFEIDKRIPRSIILKVSDDIYENLITMLTRRFQADAQKAARR